MGVLSVWMKIVRRALPTVGRCAALSARAEALGRCLDVSDARVCTCDVWWKDRHADGMVAEGIFERAAGRAHDSARATERGSVEDDIVILGKVGRERSTNYG